MLLFKTSFGGRFVALTILGYAFAIACTYAAVTLASKPSLQSMQRRALVENAQTLSVGVSRELDEVVYKLANVTGNRDVIRYVIGDSDRADLIEDFLTSVELPDGLSRTAFYDFEGRRVLELAEDSPEPSPFSNANRLAMVQALMQGGSEQRLVSFRPAIHGEEALLLIGLPIASNGFVEGVGLFDLTLRTMGLLERTTSIGTATLATDFQVEMAPIWAADAAPTVVIDIEGIDANLVLRPDEAAVAAIGGELVARVLVALCFFLTIPFGIMCVAGLRSIVGPHKELAASREKLREKQAELRELAAISEHSNDAILVVDLEGIVVWANKAAESLTGYSRADFRGRVAEHILQGPDTDPETLAAIEAAMAERCPIRTEILYYCADGTPYWSSVSLAPLTDDQGEPYRFVVISTDISEVKSQQVAILEAKKAVETQAFHDHLTGLPNRRLLDTALEELSNTPDEDRILVRIDLDHFKTVNDTLGHAAGDQVLREVSARILEEIGPNDLATRVGGDEFVLLLGKECRIQCATGLSERLLGRLQEQMSYNGKPMRVGASFGIASTFEGLLKQGELLIGADAALYDAKAKGRNAVVVYTADLHSAASDKRRKTTEVERAMSWGEFEPFFQPQFHAQTHAIVGAEALARWRHPTNGLLSPSSFLPTVEHLAMVDDLDAQMMEKGLSCVRHLADVGLQIPKISFNVMANRLESGEAGELALKLLPEGTNVAFEVLESVLLEEQSAIFQFQVDRLRDMGLRFEVDDFGSGHASIIGLMKLRPDVMKIDQRIVLPAPKSKTVRRMLQSIIDIGRALDIQVTAEGVETAEHAHILADMGCDTLQGFYFAKPMSASDFEAFLAKYKAEMSLQDMVARCG